MMSELAHLITELKHYGEALIILAESMAALSTAPVEETVTVEQVRAVLTDKSRTGSTTQIRELLATFGAKKLSDIDPKKYAALLAKAQALPDA